MRIKPKIAKTREQTTTPCCFYRANAGSRHRASTTSRPIREHGMLGMTVPQARSATPRGNAKKEANSNSLRHSVENMKVPARPDFVAFYLASRYRMIAPPQNSGGGPTALAQDGPADPHQFIADQVASAARQLLIQNVGDGEMTEYPDGFSHWPVAQRNAFFKAEATPYRERQADLYRPAGGQYRSTLAGANGSGKLGDSLSRGNGTTSDSGSSVTAVKPCVALIRGDTIKPRPIGWLWRGWLARGKMHILEARREPVRQQSGCLWRRL
jgi:hypothetical protein